MKVNYGDYLTFFEISFRDVTKLRVSNNILARLKVDIKRELFHRIVIDSGMSLTLVKKNIWF